MYIVQCTLHMHIDLSLYYSYQKYILAVRKVGHLNIKAMQLLGLRTFNSAQPLIKKGAYKICIFSFNIKTFFILRRAF